MDEHWIYKDQEEGKLKPIYGLLLFLVVMASFYTIISWAQRRWGMYGLALTELYLLFLSLLATKLARTPLSEVFPIKKPEWKKILAVFLFLGASYALLIPLTMTVAYFFPREMFSVSAGLNDFITTVPALLSMGISCIMPAICEEALHRGFILKSLQSRLKQKWLLVLLMGLLFGLFHGSIWRFLPTAVLGGVLTYLMVETENMVYPALFHFLNNWLPSLLSSPTSTAAETQAATDLLIQEGFPLVFLGFYLVIACVAPFGFHTAAYLLRKGEPHKSQRYFPSNVSLVTVVVLTVLPILLGMALFVYGLVYDTSMGDFMQKFLLEWELLLF